MSDHDESSGFAQDMLMLAGVYLLLQGIVNSIARTTGPGKVSALGVVGMQFFYIFALASHVTGDFSTSSLLTAGHCFAFVYVLALFSAIVERIAGRNIQ